MAVRKPLVVVDGWTRQLPDGDTLDATTAEVDSYELVNAGSLERPIGTPVYISGSGEFDAARANARATVGVFGLIRSAAIAAASSGTIQTDGVLTATTAQWDALTGQTGGLTPGAPYWLSAATAGHLTSTAPSATGNIVLIVGRGVTEETFEISIGTPVEL